MHSKSLFIYKLLFGLILLIVLPATQARMYRWYDEDGNVHFSDKIPPEHSKYKRESLSSQAKVIKKETVEAAKSKDQINMEFRLEALRKQQEKLIAKQHAYDKVLRSTFRTVEDMERALERKNKAYEIRRNGIIKQLEFQTVNLQEQQGFAANYERLGKPVPDKVLKQIDEYEKRIAETKTRIAELDATKQAELKTFNNDINRFKFLTKADQQDENFIDKEVELEAANNLGVFTCESEQLCTQAWDLAKQFVTQNSDTEIELESDELIMTTPPQSVMELSLSLSKLTLGGKKPQIFLDIRCHDSSAGQALCADNKIKAIRKSFRPYILSQLTIQ